MGRINKARRLCLQTGVRPHHPLKLKWSSHMQWGPVQCWKQLILAALTLQLNALTGTAEMLTLIPTHHN